MDNMSKMIESHVEIPEIFTLAYSFVREQFDILLSFKECFNLYNAIKMVDSVEGDIIEVGTYGGGSAKLISLFANNTKKIYTFDTYEGLMDVDNNDVYHSTQYMNNGDFAQSFEMVSQKFTNNKSVVLNKGYFPDCSNFEDGKLFSFVHLDVDTYQSTLNCLRYLYPRLMSNGVIISHDYNNYPTPGVKKAFSEFFKDKPEHIIPLWDTQCMIIKI